MKNGTWDTIIEPKAKLWSIDLKELWRYRDLIWMYVKRNYASYYKQTILGPLWFFIQPIITTIMYMLVFGNIAKIPTDNIPQPLFYLAGQVCWNYFSSCLNKCSGILSGYQGVFSKVYFPRLVMPISTVIFNLFTAGIQFFLFIVVYIIFVINGLEIEVNEYILLMPLTAIFLAMIGLGVGLMISSVTVKYRDLGYLTNFGVQLWMYATPIIYPLSIVQRLHPDIKHILMINPITPFIESFKLAFLGQGYFSWSYYAYGAALSIITMIAGVLVFNKVQRNYMDIV